jgi:hypothetical protein
MDQYPNDMTEWYTYIQELDVSDLTDKAYAVNGITFVEILQEEGYSPQDIEDILYWFAERLDEEETTFLPKKGAGFYCSYQRILRKGRSGS